MFRGIFGVFSGAVAPIFFLLLAQATQLANEASAWDRHDLLTSPALHSMMMDLPNELEVHSLEAAVARMAPGCSVQDFFKNALGGVGPRYRVAYAKGAQVKLDISPDLLSIQTLVKYFGESAGHGDTTSAVETLSIYSNESDWAMDEDVPGLNHTGSGTDVAGTGSVFLRHFLMPHSDPEGATIETLPHTQRLYDASQAAFAAGETYWGYRFLAQALHYVQDLGQPFHVKLFPSYRMIRSTDVLRSSLCDKIRQARKKDPSKYNDPKLLALCNEGSMTEAQAVYLSGLAVSVYHNMYEGYAREMLLTGDKEASQVLMGKRPERNASAWERLPVLVEPKFTTVSAYMDQLAQQTYQYAFILGDLFYDRMGGSYKSEKLIRYSLDTLFTSENPGAKYYHSSHLSEDYKDQRMRAMTLEMLHWSGKLTRTLVLMASTEAADRKAEENQALLERFATQCRGQH